MKYFILIFSLLFGASAFAQDSNFKKIDFDSLYDEWMEATKEIPYGFKVIPFNGYQSIVEIVGIPVSCRTEALEYSIKMLGALESYKKMAIKKCFKFRQNKNGRIYTAFLQDSILKPFLDELQIGSKILLQVRLSGIKFSGDERDMLFTTILFQRMTKGSERSSG